MGAAGRSTFAWEPLTPRGVAAFARAPLGRLLLVQLIVALLAAACVVWFLDGGVFPVVRTAIQNLPDAGQIRSTKLDWRGDSPKLLAEGRFLALDVDLNHSGKIVSTADAQVEFGKESIRLSSLAGYADFVYPEGDPLPFNRQELEPLWGAWRAEVLFIAFVAVATGLMLCWWLLATVYLTPVWIFGFFLNRDLNLYEGWKLSGAALMPGGVLMCLSIALYGFGRIDLAQFGFMFGAHFILGWAYLVVSVMFLNRKTSKKKKNPFARGG
jgi:hypothetical protein